MPEMKSCDAPGCDQQVRRGILMCRSHWYQVPKPLRQAINETWRNRDTRAWLKNVRQAQALLTSNSDQA